jgi:hypothetical protein
MDGEDLLFFYYEHISPNFHPSHRELISGSWSSKLPFPFPQKLLFSRNKQKISKLLSLNSHFLLSITPTKRVV